MSEMICLKENEGEKLELLTDNIRVLAKHQDFEVFENSGVRESGPPPHFHHWSEAYFVLEGKLQVNIGQQEYAGGAGAFFHVPGNTIHSYKIQSDSCRFIVITSPAGAYDMFVELQRETSLPAIVTIAQKHGLNVTL